MKTNRIVCFTGHRPQNLPFGFNEEDDRCRKLKELLRESIVDLIENHGATRFISGMALGVDMYAAQIVLEEKRTFRRVTLECAIPCKGQVRYWTPEQKTVYRDILQECDKITLLQHEYTSDCMEKRNRYLVDSADIVLAVWDGSNGGTANTVRYAQAQDKEILVISPNAL